MTKDILKFADGYKTQIENGEKKITIRKGIIENIFPYSIQKTNLGFSLRITSVLYTTFREVPYVDLKDDGFKGLKEFMKQMEAFYPIDLVLDDMCTVIRFKTLR